ncbi:hypothetical protein Pla108_10860 [Botrimarina colliarenosi]|uniref:Uncharacterized protein n=1 Tax=Botrimarina colliarenosi TaxID=2528001 RepID=A0A5C6AMB7_9BACT|nr:hypothetical protein [Botrimarina colliarenosi]TWU00142.1 hypothetical protein Pla108_10860 [Botrimarina colliarenosi]
MSAEEASADEPPAEATPAPLQRVAAIDWVVGFFAMWGTIDVVHGVVPYLTGDGATQSIALAGVLPLAIAWGLYRGHSAGHWWATLFCSIMAIGYALIALFLLGSGMLYLAGNPFSGRPNSGEDWLTFARMAIVAPIAFACLRVLQRDDVTGYFNDPSRERRPVRLQIRHLFLATLMVVIGLVTIDLDPRITTPREIKRMQRERQEAAQAAIKQARQMQQELQALNNLSQRKSQEATEAANGGTPAPTSVPDVSPNGQ